MSETETTTKPPSSRYSLISLLRSLHKASGKDVQVSDSNECLNKNSNAIEGQCSEPINEGKCCCGTEDKEKNSNRTSEEGDRNNPENVAESPIREVDSSSLLGLEPIWGKYAIEEYIEKDGKYYRTWSQEDAIQSSADPVNMTPLEMSRLKPENLKNQSISEESENLSDSPQDIEKWYKRERLSHQKLLHEMGIPNMYKEILQDQSTDDVEVLSISTVDHDVDFTEFMLDKGHNGSNIEDEENQSDVRKDDGSVNEEDGSVDADDDDSDDDSVDAEDNDFDDDSVDVEIYVSDDDCVDEEDEKSSEEEGSSSVERSEEVLYEENVDNYTYDNSSTFVGNLVYGWSRIVKCDEDRNFIYDKWISDLEVWERKRLMWLDEMSHLEGFDSSDYKDRTFLVKVNKPPLSDSLPKQSSADPVNMTSLEMSRLKPENLKNQSISEESENLLDSPQDIEKWYKRELLHEMGMYKEILQDQSTDDMEVLSISTADHDYQEDDGIIDTAKSVPKEQPFNYDISVDIALVFQFTDRHLWRRYHGYWKRSKPEDLSSV